MIKWNNILALALAILVVVLLIRHGPALAVALASMQAIGPGNSAEDKTLGLITLGIVGVCLVAIVRLVVRNDRK